MMYFPKVFLILALFTGALLQFSLALPRSFIDEALVRIDAITGAFAPNPRKKGMNMLLLAAKEGTIVVMEDPDNSDDHKEIADFSNRICTNGERGVQTIRPHPDFGKENLYIFIYYTKSRDGCHEDKRKGPRNRLSRFEIEKDSLKIIMDSEKILLETSPLAKRVHNGGAIQFGKDGKIWVATGEGSATSTDLDWAQDPSVLHGKILRINQDGSIPADNPFVQNSNSESCHENGGSTSENMICSEIWAIGMRNPFRMVMDPSTEDGHVSFHVGDVGAAVWEEISVGGTDYPGVNYGWNEKEGPCKRNRNDDCPMERKYMDPFYYYEHRKQVQGGAVVGSAFVPNGIWPSKYKYMFIDFVFKEIYNLIEDKDRECRHCIPPVPGYKNETFYQNKDDQSMIDMFFGPYKNTQALYIIGRGPGKTVRRIRYTGEGERNRSPNANLQIRDKDGIVFSVKEEIRLDGRRSDDPDGDSIEYFWDFGDGTTLVGDSRPEHSYREKGEYLITLTVKDAKGLKDSDSVKVKIGVPPTAIIITPEKGSTFSVEQKLELSGIGIDSEGSEETQLFWEARQHHADHWHPFLSPGTKGNNFMLFPAPEPEDLLAATNSYLEIRLTVLDKDGLSATTSRNVMPEVVTVEVDSDPQGMKVVLDASEVITPATITSWKNHNLLLDVEDHFPYIFEQWSHGEKTTKRRQQTRVSLSNNFFRANFKRSEAREIDLVRLVRECSDNDKCDQCEGHCHDDNECFGDLICFKKGGRSKPVPGCIGIDNSKTDWCTFPSFIPSPFSETLETSSNDQGTSETAPSRLPLDGVRDCSSNNQCNQCEGHCQNDDECIGELVCFKKGGRGKPVPGCIGIDPSKTDWCTVPMFIAASIMIENSGLSNEQSTSEIAPSTMPLSFARECSIANQCNQCEGHCKNDDECIDDLLCFKKTLRGTIFPGCDGIDNSQTNRCTSLSFVTESVIVPSNLTPTVPVPPADSLDCPDTCQSNNDCCTNTCAFSSKDEGTCVDFSFIHIIAGLHRKP